MAAAMRAGSPARRCTGAAYLSLLLAVALLGLGLLATAELWTQSRQREQEAELVRTGIAVREALRRYYLQSPGARRLPKSLDELLHDARGPVPRRHLRRLPRDPFGGQDLLLLRDAQGGIIGVHSASTRSPLRRQGWPEAAGPLDPRAGSYRQWLFIADLSSNARLSMRRKPVAPGTASPAVPPAAAEPASAPASAANIPA